MAYFAIRDAVGHDYCVTIADESYLSDFRKHAAWWKRHIRSANAETRAKYERGSGMPCFPVKVVMEA